MPLQPVVLVIPIKRYGLLIIRGRHGWIRRHKFTRRNGLISRH